MKNPNFAIAITSLYLLTYIILLETTTSLSLAFTLFAISPFLLLWMIYTVLKYGVYTGKELEKNEEWGYQDIKKEDLSN